MIQSTFPRGLLLACPTDTKFESAKSMLINDFGFMIEPKDTGKYRAAFVLPRTDVCVEDILKNAQGKEVGWGVGRARFSKYHPNFKAATVDFRYFSGDCPEEIIKMNPAKDAIISLYELLKPTGVLDIYAGSKWIEFPYKNN